jgi:hypothetical protein
MQVCVTDMKSESLAILYKMASVSLTFCDCRFVGNCDIMW